MKRYQNPDVFEPLAMAYVLGTLQGRARERFKTLMSRHFYLRVVTEAYEQQFAGLIGLLPLEEPSPAVWQRLEAELGLAHTKSVGKAEEKKSSWLEWFHWPAMAVASILAAVITMVALNNSPATNAYFAKLHSPSLGSVAMASVSKDDMQITVALADKVAMPEGMTVTLWCFSKDPNEKPMRMGTLKALGNSELDIDASTWQGLENVSKLAISLEPTGHAEAVEPLGEVVFSGDLVRAE
uniref:Anti-sigma-K factor RskA n=1 Tax=uncultured Thiotrichaceae bacterium TaxID=298394 RepID=A0A6S6UN34_9GAMM|nr:MAG: Anti-sigma-K factor RskA [uncultured Thiotrichaceae bacterium]